MKKPLYPRFVLVTRRKKWPVGPLLQASVAATTDLLAKPMKPYRKAGEVGLSGTSGVRRAAQRLADLVAQLSFGHKQRSAAGR